MVNVQNFLNRGAAIRRDMSDTPRSFMREQDRSHPSAWEVDFWDITDSRYQ